MSLLNCLVICLTAGIAIGSPDNDRDKEHALNMAKTYFSKYNKDSASLWIERAEHYASLSADTAVLCKTSSIRGYISMNYDADFVKAGQYFLQSYNYAVAIGDEKMGSTALADLVMTYYNRHDTTGIQYARKLYGTYRDNRNSMGFIMGAVSLSFMYEVMEDYENALKYAETALKAYGSNPVPTTVYALYASLLSYTGHDEDAAAYFRKGLSAEDAENIWLEYAEFLMKHKKWQEAVRYLEADLKRMEEDGIILHTINHHKNLSEAYKAMGDYASALKHYQEYARLQSDIFSVEKESAINDLLIKYETEQKNMLIKSHELNLAKKSANIQILIFCLCIAALGGIAAWIMYWRTNRMYKAAVARHQDYLREISRLTGQENDKGPSDSQNDKSKELFTAIEELMREKRIYTVKGLTLESLAEQLHSNRGYVSRAINLYAGLSFNSYINNFRVNAAARMLCETDIPVKAIADELGFNSSSVFYRVFQQSIGVPPAKYRKETRNSEREELNSINEDLES